MSLENLELVAQLRARQERLEALLEANRQLSRIQPIDTLLTRIAEACGHLVGSDSVGFRLVEGDELVVAGTWGDVALERATGRLRMREGLNGIVATTGQPMIVNDVLEDPRVLPENREALRRLGHRVFLGVPVKIGDRVLGVLSIRRRDREFTGDDLAIASAFASQAAVAIENARLYQEVQRAYEDLERAQDQLAQSQKMEAIGRLAGGVAHDFNNLLTVVIGRAVLLLERLGPESPHARDVRLIRETADRAAALTQQLLTFGRKQVLQPRVIDLNELVARTGAMLRPLIGEEHELFIGLSSRLHPVKVDPGRFEQVLVNLVVNARDAMPGGGHVTIETASVEPDGSGAHPDLALARGAYSVLAVSDTGSGMDAATRARVFEPFFTTKERGKGTGLGLATVYGIVEQSGGHIDVESEPGRGTTFRIYLPSAGAEVESDEDGPVVAGRERGSERILLVEDEEDLRDLLREILETAGYSVEAAADGRAALSTFEERAASFDLVLTDVIMPRMGGPELVRRLAALQPTLRVLFISGYTGSAIARHGVLESDVPFLEKPFTPDAVAGKVREALDGGLAAIDVARRTGGS